MSMGFILSYSQYFYDSDGGRGPGKDHRPGAGPYIQSGDRSLSSVYSTAFVGSALLVFFIFEGSSTGSRKEKENREAEDRRPFGWI